MAQNQIRQGNTFEFKVKPSGEGASGLTGVFEVKQYPGDAAAVSRSLTNNGDGTFTGILTNAETDTLAIGQWMVITKFTDLDEYITDPIKLYIEIKWV